MHSTLFDEAQAEVYARLGDLYSSFRRSDEFERLLDRLTFTSFGVNDNLNELLELVTADSDGPRSPLLVSLGSVPPLHFGALPALSASASSSASASASASSSISASPTRVTDTPPSNVEFARWKREQDAQMSELTRALQKSGQVSRSSPPRLTNNVKSCFAVCTRAHFCFGRSARVYQWPSIAHFGAPPPPPTSWRPTCLNCRATVRHSRAAVPATHSPTRTAIIDLDSLPPLPRRPDQPLSERHSRRQFARPSLSPRRSPTAEAAGARSARHRSRTTTPRSPRMTSPRHKHTAPAAALSPRHGERRSSPRHNERLGSPRHHHRRRRDADQRQRLDNDDDAQHRTRTAWSSSSPSTTPRVPSSGDA